LSLGQFTRERVKQLRGLLAEMQRVRLVFQLIDKSSDTHGRDEKRDHGRDVLGFIRRKDPVVIDQDKERGEAEDRDAGKEKP